MSRSLTRAVAARMLTAERGQGTVEYVGIVLSVGNITSAQLSKILHGELLPQAERSAFLAAQLADMEYGARGM